MPQQRRAAWALIASLLATMSFAAPAFAGDGGGPVDKPLVDDPTEVCAPGHLPTRWMDELRPPPTVRVLRSKGPTNGDVDVVPLWDYVGRVVRAEYSSGGTKPYPWMHVGALTVKQYAWYYSMNWRGGRVHKANPDGSTTTKCYDLKDTTADQIYTDLKADPANPGQWIEANAPTPANLKAMRETWHLTLRKWQADKNKSRIYLTGYRSGKQFPCGADSTGFKIYQKSLRDCGTKNLNFEEVLREYFEPGLIVDTRGDDVLSDGNAWLGDLGVLTPGTGQWRLFKGSADSFTAGPTGTFAGLGQVLGQGAGNVDSANPNGSNNEKLFADLVILTASGNNRSVAVAHATGDGFAQPTSQAAPSGAERLVVGDFDGDLLADAGFLSTVSPGNSKLSVMPADGAGGFNGAVDWWTGALDLSATDFASAADTNGDGMADLVMRNAAGIYSVALSSASCSDLTAWGACPAGAVGPNSLAAATQWLSWAQADVKHVVGDFDRDGRDDLIVVVKDANGVKVMGLRTKTEGTFAAPQQLWASASVAFADVVPMALNVNADGMADLALVTKNGSLSKVQWLRTNERTTVPASMTATTPFDSSLAWSAGNRPF